MLAHPSRTDINSLKEIYDKVKHVLPGTILIIAGKDENINLIVQSVDVIEMRILSKEKERKE